MIIVENLNKKIYDSQRELIILDDISFKIEQGEKVAIVGASGSGKSTLLGLLAGLDLPTSGHVVINGQSIFNMSEDERAVFRSKYIGFVFQSFHLLPHLTALDNVELALELSGLQSNRTVRASTLLTKVGLGSRLHHYPHHLSGGEQQRVALARAFVSNPALLLADEPTGSLDMQTGSLVMDLMFELNQKQGATLILVTHDAHIAKQCDRVLTIHAGKMLSDEHKQNTK